MQTKTMLHLLTFGLIAFSAALPLGIEIETSITQRQIAYAFESPYKNVKDTVLIIVQDGMKFATY